MKKIVILLILITALAAAGCTDNNDRHNIEVTYNLATTDLTVTDLEINFYDDDSVILEWNTEGGKYPADYFVVREGVEILDNTTENRFITDDIPGSFYSIYPVDTQGNIGPKSELHYRANYFSPKIFYDGYSGYYPKVGTPVRFNGSDSIVSMGTIETNISYTWIFNDDITSTQSGIIVDHVFDKSGNNKVELVIEDDRGYSESTIEVYNIWEE